MSVITVSHTTQIDGNTRLRFKRGWSSLVGKNGNALFISQDDEATHFKVVADKLEVRADAKDDSEVVGELKKNDIVRVNGEHEMVPGAIMIAQGKWVSKAIQPAGGKKKVEALKISEIWDKFEQVRIKEGKVKKKTAATATKGAAKGGDKSLKQQLVELRVYHKKLNDLSKSVRTPVLAYCKAWLRFGGDSYASWFDSTAWCLVLF